MNWPQCSTPRRCQVSKYLRFCRRCWRLHMGARRFESAKRIPHISVLWPLPLPYWRWPSRKREQLQRVVRKMRGEADLLTLTKDGQKKRRRCDEPGSFQASRCAFRGGVYCKRHASWHKSYWKLRSRLTSLQPHIIKEKDVCGFEREWLFGVPPPKKAD